MKVKWFEQGPINKHLEEIIKQEISEHERLLLQRNLPHSIDIVSSDEYEGLNISEFMCFEFVFDMLQSKVEIYKDVLDYQKGWKINPIGADKGFFLFLERNNKIEEIRLSDVKDGNWIIYYNNDQPIHAGKMTKNRVRSKWGAGLLLEHEIHEVPEKYGNIVRFFKSSPLEVLKDLFISYAEEQGIEFQEVEAQ